MKIGDKVISTEQGRASYKDWVSGIMEKGVEAYVVDLCENFSSEGFKNYVRVKTSDEQLYTRTANYLKIISQYYEIY